MPGAPSQAAVRSEVRTVISEAEFSALRPAWNEIAAASADRSVFHMHEWFDAAWQWRKAKARLHLLCHHRDERLVAVLPLVAQDARVHGIPVRELTFLTVPDTQWADVIVAPSDAAQAAEAFAAELDRQRGGWDVLRLMPLRQGAVATLQLGPALARHHVRLRNVAAPGNPFIALDGSWTAFYDTRSRRLKKANNLAGNRLRRAGGVQVDWHGPDIAGAGTIADIEAQVTAVSAASWKARTGTSLDQPGPQAFVRRLSEHATRRGWLSIWRLSLDGRPVAMEYQLMAFGDVFALRSDFDMTLEEVSPGSSLNRHMLEQLFARGLHRYYMGPGRNAYKYRWTDDVEPVEELTAYGRSWRGRWLHMLETSIKPAVTRLRSRTPRSDEPGEDGAKEGP